MPDIEIFRTRAIGGDLHAEHPAEAWIEFDSMITVQPRQGNRSRSIEDARTRGRIADIVGALVLP